MERVTIEQFLEQGADTELAGTDRLILNSQQRTVLSNIKAQSQAEMLELAAHNAPAEEFKTIYQQKAYEVKFIDYLLELSSTNTKRIKEGD